MKNTPCKRRELRVLLLREGDEMNGGKKESPMEEPVEVAKMVELSLNSVVGSSPPRIMILRGTVRQ